MLLFCLEFHAGLYDMVQTHYHDLRGSVSWSLLPLYSLRQCWGLSLNPFWKCPFPPPLHCSPPAWMATSLWKLSPVIHLPGLGATPMPHYFLLPWSTEPTEFKSFLYLSVSLLSCKLPKGRPCVWLVTEYLWNDNSRMSKQLWTCQGPPLHHPVALSLCQW